MKNWWMKVVLLVAVFLIALPGFSTMATEQMSSLTPEEIKALQTGAGDFEQEVSSFFLGVGDFAQNFLKKVLGEEITVDKLVYNNSTTLNANFFDNTTNPSSSDVTAVLKEVINNWFRYFRSLTLIIVLISLVLAGIKILIQTPNAKVSAGEMVKKVVMAVALVFFFPYAMKYAFEINEAIVKAIERNYAGGGSSLYEGVVSEEPEIDDELEFRSPKYIMANQKPILAGSVEATKMYLEKTEEYVKKLDVMRLMRAYAGVTLRFVYVVLWYILLAQMYILTIMYLKRYLMIAFLITIYPLVVIGYIYGGMFGKRQTAFNTWSKTFFTNVFTQTIHAVIYGVVSNVLLNQITRQLDPSGAAGLNVFLMILATSFLFQGEKLLSRFWKASIDVSERKGLRGMFKGPKRMLNLMKGK